MKASQVIEAALSALLLAIVSACADQVAKQESSTPPASPVTSASPTQSGGAQQGSVSGTQLGAGGAAADKRSVYYDFDKYAIKPEFESVVLANASYLTRHSGAKVRIEGNCDERGSSEYNIALGQRRADGVKKMLELTGVPDAQIETVSYGKEKPRALGHDEQSWAENRRSDFDYLRQ